MYFSQPFGILEKVPPLPLFPSSLPKQLFKQHPQLKERKYSKKSSSPIWRSKRKWLSNLLPQISRLKGKPLQRRKQQLKSQYCKHQPMKKELRKGIGKRKLLLQPQQIKQGRSDRGLIFSLRRKCLKDQLRAWFLLAWKHQPAGNLLAWKPQSAADYIRTNLEVFTKDIHPMDQIELHKQTREMVYSTLADKSLMAHRLQNSLHNTAAQLELEKASSQAKDNIIKSLEEIIIELGHDPNDRKGVQGLMKKKDEDITALRKQIKLPPTLHPQTEGVVQQKKDQDVVTLLLALHKRLVETEGALEETLKAKQGELAPQTTQTARAIEDTPHVITLAGPPTGQTSEAGPSSSAPAPEVIA